MTMIGSFYKQMFPSYLSASWNSLNLSLFFVLSEDLQSCSTIFFYISTDYPVQMDIAHFFSIVLILYLDTGNKER
jgi:hypothetical protein